MWGKLRNAMHLRYYVIVEHVETLVTGWCLCILCICVCVSVWCPSLRCGFASLSDQEIWSCLCMIHMQQTLWDATDTLSWPRNATRTSTRQQCGVTVTVTLWLFIGVLPVSNRGWGFLVFSQCLPERASVVECVWNLMAHGDAREGKWRGNWRMEWVASTLILPRNLVYPALLTLMPHFDCQQSTELTPPPI
jgi:hypothetical protein